MKFEHFALNVPDAPAHARWYVEHLGFRVLRHREDAPHTHFLGDDTGRVFMEFYTNASAVTQDFPSMHPLVFHIGLAVTDARADRARLEKAGASPAYEEAVPDGTLLIMLRDPWGVPLQLCQRTTSF